MKTHVLILSQTFPKGHPDAGKPTRFGASVTQCVKIHTIREDFESWGRKINEVKNGVAVLSVRVWEGVPYRSKQMELLRLTAENGVDIQKLHGFDGVTACFMGTDNNLVTVPLQELANNDGLSLDEWRGWFTDIKSRPLAVIHFTDFRYR